MTYRLSRGERLKRQIEWLATTSAYDKPNDDSFNQHWAEAMRQLAYLAPDTMRQEHIAQRWPNILTALIVTSEGYFTPRSAANALLLFKLNRPFGCEMYCAYAGFERDGWPSDPREYDAKLLETGRRFLRRSISRGLHHLERDDASWKYARHLVDQMAHDKDDQTSLASWF
jgi:hypothetical protein